MRVCICMLHIRDYHIYAIIYIPVIYVTHINASHMQASICMFHMHDYHIDVIIYMQIICVYPYVCFIYAYPYVLIHMLVSYT